MRGMSYPTLRDKQPYQHDSTWMSSVDNSGVLEGRWPLNHQNAGADTSGEIIGRLQEKKVTAFNEEYCAEPAGCVF